MKVILTGASRGIGVGIAQVLGAEGFRLGLLARTADQLGTLAEELTKNGVTVAWRACDLRNPDETETAIAALCEEIEGVDVLINNAGLVIRKSVFDLRLDEWHDMVNTNINGVFYATRAVLPAMRAQGRGHIVNISSISGKMPLPGGSAYAATKFAVTGFSQSLFQEVRDYGIKVTTLYPGSVDSITHRHDPSDEHTWKITPEEVGRVCLSVLRTGPGNCISEVEVRPLQRPRALK